MILLGIALIAVGIALVCAGVVLRPRTPLTDPATHDSPDEFRTILDALGADDRRDESRDLDRDLDELPATDPPTDPSDSGMIQPGRQRRPQLG
ncbi:MAG TPA: hypothetical protein VE999_12365 [Gemmataceae bacterium]|nr:hypothetical protein [Gemmataceae bacterium]